MRQIGTIEQESLARKFAAHLLTEGIKSHLELTDERWEIWIRDEDALSVAKDELRQFIAEPNANRYEGAEDRANEIAIQEYERDQEAKRNVVEMSGNWKTPGATVYRRPLTIILIMISIALTLTGGTISFDSDKSSHASDSLVERALYFRDPELVSATAPANSKENMSIAETFASIKSGEVWRLVTPIFLHASLFHIFFNMYILYHFGSQIEHHYGTWKFAWLVILFAIFSNVAQAVLHDPYFLGFSGVGYGLFGFAWMISLYEPSRGIYVTQLTVIILMGWFAACFLGFFPNVANWAHAGGLVAGLLAGFLFVQKR